MTNSQLCLDTNFLVGLFDSADVWHRNSLEIYSYLRGREVQLVYFDCVLNELFSVLARRCRERGKESEFWAWQHELLKQSQLLPSLGFIPTYLDGMSPASPSCKTPKEGLTFTMRL